MPSRNWFQQGSVQFRSVSQLCLTLCNPMNWALQASLSITNSLSPPKPMSIELVMPYSHLVPLNQSLPSGSFHKPLILLHQRADRLKTTITENQPIWSHEPTALSNSAKLWAMPCRATQDRRVMVRVLTKRGPLEKGMANHLSVLALRTPLAAWRGDTSGIESACQFGREISVTSDAQMRPPLWQEVKRSSKASWWKWKRRAKKLA